MANWNIALFSKWIGPDRNDMAVAITYPGSWSDMGRQDDIVIKNRSINFCTMVHGVVDDVSLALINADVHYLILARWEEAAPGVALSFDNRQNTVTLAQKNAFVTYFQNEFGINLSKIPQIDNAVGKTRIQVWNAVVDDIKRLT